MNIDKYCIGLVFSTLLNENTAEIKKNIPNHT